MTGRPAVDRGAAVAGVLGHVWRDLERAQRRDEACRVEVLVTADGDRESWLGLSEQALRRDRWSACRVQAAAICGSFVK
jgi:hypothetical protein